jgi:hypothetical protein
MTIHILNLLIDYESKNTARALCISLTIFIGYSINLFSLKLRIYLLNPCTITYRIFKKFV